LLVKNVDFLLTFKCPAECQHCSYKGGPNRTGNIKPKDSSQYLKELTEMHPLKSVWIHGGEPFLYFDYLEHIIKEANKFEIPDIGVITNSYWAKSEKIAKERLERLKKAGLMRVTFSFDAFHQEFIPVENVRNALKSALIVGFKGIYIDSYFVNDLISDNYFNLKTKEILVKLNDIKEVAFHKYIMGVEGRAANLAQYMNLKKGIPSGKCPLPFWIEGNLQNPETIEIDGDGNVTLCPGICIGNTNIHSLSTIIQNYNCNNHPILSIIWKEGPKGLLEIAKAKGYDLDQEFANECHLCYEMRKFLQPNYPLYLAPKQCY